MEWLKALKFTVEDLKSMNVEWELAEKSACVSGAEG